MKQAIATAVALLMAASGAWAQERSGETMAEAVMLTTQLPCAVFVGFLDKDPKYAQVEGGELMMGTMLGLMVGYDAGRGHEGRLLATVHELRLTLVLRACRRNPKLLFIDAIRSADLLLPG